MVKSDQIAKSHTKDEKIRPSIKDDQTKRHDIYDIRHTHYTHTMHTHARTDAMARRQCLKHLPHEQLDGDELPLRALGQVVQGAPPKQRFNIVREVTRLFEGSRRT